MRIVSVLSAAGSVVVLLLTAAVWTSDAEAVPVSYYVGASAGLEIPGDGRTDLSADTGVYTAARTTLFGTTPGSEPVRLERRTDYLGLSTLFVAFTPSDLARITRLAGGAILRFTADGEWDGFQATLYDYESATGALLVLGQGTAGSGQGSGEIVIDLANPAVILPAGHRLRVELEAQKPAGGAELAVTINGPGEVQSVVLEVDEETDTVPPVTVMSTSPVRPTGAEGWFIGAPPLVTLTAADAEGSAATVYYDLEIDPPSSVYTGTFTIPAGESVLYYRAVDIFGNQEPVQSQSFQVDTGVAAPTMSSPTGAEDAPARLRGAVLVEASASDGVSGVEEVAFFAFARQGDGWGGVGIAAGPGQQTPVSGETYTSTWDTSLVPDGEYRLEAWVRDVAGNQATSQPQIVLVDNTGPLLLIEEPEAGARVRGDGLEITGSIADGDLAGWTLELVDVGAAAATELAGGTKPVDGDVLAVLDSTEYPDGRYELRLVAGDNTANTSVESRAPVLIDNTGPTIVDAASGGADQVLLSFSEELAPDSVTPGSFIVSGLDVAAAVLGGDGREVILSTSDQEDGTDYEVTIAAAPLSPTDLAGNATEPESRAVFTGSTVDSVAPHSPKGLQAWSGAAKNVLTWEAGPEPDLAGFIVQRDTEAYGDFSFRLDEVSAGTVEFADTTLPAPGVYYYRVIAVDDAGNESQPSPVSAADQVRIREAVGPAGDSLLSSTGAVGLQIPEGALGQEITVEIIQGARPPTSGPYSFVGPAYDLLPAGQTFAADVSLTLAYDAVLASSVIGRSTETTGSVAATGTPSAAESEDATATAPPAEAAAEDAIRVVYEKEGEWIRTEGGSAVDAASRRVTGRSRHFTPFAAAVTDVVPPTVVEVSPLDGAVGLPVTAEVKLTFSEPMDPDTLTVDSLRLSAGDVPVIVEPVVLSADFTTAYLYSEEALDVSTEYTVLVDGGTVADAGGNLLGESVRTTFVTSGEDLSPHSGYAATPGFCTTCHGEGSPTARVGSGEKDVCYTCHDGSGSAYGVKTVDPYAPYSSDFGERPAGTTDYASYHPVPRPTSSGTGVIMTCSNCHNAHSLDDAGPRSLVVRSVDPALTGEDKTVAGNEACWACHNTSAGSSAGYVSTESWNASTGYDHKTGYPSGDTGHNKLTGELSMVNPWVPTEAQIACKGCHSEHGTPNDSLIAPQVNGRNVTFEAGSDQALNATYNGLCGACHSLAGSGGPYWPGGALEGPSTVATGTVGGLSGSPGSSAGTPGSGSGLPLGTAAGSGETAALGPTYTLSGHGSSVKTRTLTYSPPVPARLQVLTVALCKQCHNPHGTQYVNYTLASEEGLCYPCHDQDGPADRVTPGNTNIFQQFNAAGRPANGVVGYRRPSGGPAAVPLARHPVVEEEQGAGVQVAFYPGGPTTAATTGAIECKNCHNPHLNGREAPPSLYWKVLDPNVQPGADGYPAVLRSYRTGNSLGGIPYNSTGGNPGPDYNPDHPLGVRPSQPYNPTDGSFESTPDSVYFCLACHDGSVPQGMQPQVSLGSAPLNIRADYLDPNTSSALAHGRGTGNNLASDDTYVRYPYRSAVGGSRGNWVQQAPARPYAALQCTTCHDAHGSQNVYLLREYIVAGGVVMNDSNVSLGGSGSRGSGQAFSLPSWPVVSDAGSYRLSNEFLVEFCGSCHSQYGDFRNHRGGLAANGGLFGTGCDTAHNWSGWDPGNRGGLHDNNETDPASLHKW